MRTGVVNHFLRVTWLFRDNIMKGYAKPTACYIRKGDWIYLEIFCYLSISSFYVSRWEKGGEDVHRGLATYGNNCQRTIAVLPTKQNLGGRSSNSCSV